MTTRNLEAAYRAEPWFTLLQAACKREPHSKVALRLGLSGSVISQVLHGTGAYGSGKASTRRLALRVEHTFGGYECPHLTQQYSEPRFVKADECRAYAHREPPTGSPGALAHWRACNTCVHKPLSAPQVVRAPVSRKAKAVSAAAAAAAAAAGTDVPTNPQPQPQPTTEEATA